LDGVVTSVVIADDDDADIRALVEIAAAPR
jgi:hypothetical protein